MSKIGLRDLILIGHVIRPHGLTGLLRIVSYAQSKETFLEAGSVFLIKGENDLYEKKVVSIRPHRLFYLLKLSGLNSIDQAEIFRGAGVFIRKDSLVKRDEDEFFWHELLGLEVYLVTGQYLGVLKEIFPTGSNDVYVVENQGKEFLIPAIHQVVKEINIAQKRMVISPMMGLLDLS
ncbi:MAG: 16S rRNA processing protein RimM [Deltaproteobacteria bacterium]|nr:MAG: 16S rRNA processing protein RimM [Deltaproteobacteria bacterium]